MASAQWTFPPDHPAAAGHFPGNPVIPGALLLTEALRAMEDGLGLSARSYRIRAAKFLAPARPGDRMLLEYSRSGGAVRFSCTAGGRVVLKGELACGNPATPA